MSIPQYTTPAFTLTWGELPFSPAGADVFVTFHRLNTTITKSGEDLTVGDGTVTVALTQAETAQLIPGPVDIQVNWLLADGSRYASEIATAEISDQLLRQVLEPDEEGAGT